LASAGYAVALTAQKSSAALSRSSEEAPTRIDFASDRCKGEHSSLSIDIGIAAHYHLLIACTRDGAIRP
jgi:hypothetical protein